MNEIWKDIEFFPLYQVSNFGNVRSPRKTLKPTPNHKGYLRVSVGGKLHTVHSLVMLAFVGKRPEGYHIEHIDHDKNNNRVENLRYCTPKENMARQVDDKRVRLGKYHQNNKISLEDATYIKYSKESNSVLGRKFGISKETARQIKVGERWKYIGVENG